MVLAVTTLDRKKKLHHYAIHKWKKEITTDSIAKFYPVVAAGLVPPTLWWTQILSPLPCGGQVLSPYIIYSVVDAGIVPSCPPYPVVDADLVPSTLWLMQVLSPLPCGGRRSCPPPC